MTDDEPKRQFTGVWIPAAVWLNPDINCVERCLLGEIQALGGATGNCFASNEYLGKQIGVSGNRAAKMLGRLRQLGLVDTDGFDGRRRYLRILYDAKAALAKTPRLNGHKRQGGVGENATVVGSKENCSLEEVVPATPEPPENYRELSYDEARKLSKAKPKKTALTDEEWMDVLKSSAANDGVDVDGEFKKASLWIATRPDRKFTRRFFERWLSRADRSVKLAPRKLTDDEETRLDQQRGLCCY